MGRCPRGLRRLWAALACAKENRDGRWAVTGPGLAGPKDCGQLRLVFLQKIPGGSVCFLAMQPSKTRPGLRQLLSASLLEEENVGT